MQSLAVNREAVFTGPQANSNRADFLTLNVSRAFAPKLAVQGVGYVRNFRQDVSNGNGSNFVPGGSFVRCFSARRAEAVKRSSSIDRMLGDEVSAPAADLPRKRIWSSTAK